jgi:CHC2 zinc finger
VGTPAPSQLVLLGEGWVYRGALFTGAHHPCLGSQRGLAYAADRGKKSVNRQALDELKQQIPLMGYLQAQDLSPARPLSGGRWMGLCPLHDDHKPSFLVDTNKDLFYCYGCGRGGDVIRFAELCHQVKFPEAVALLLQWRGVEHSLLQEAARFYRIQLHRHSEAVAYLYQRGVRSWATIERSADWLRARRLPAKLADAVGPLFAGSASGRPDDHSGIRRIRAAYRFSAGRQSLWP